MQALIDALPAADGITPETRAEAEAKLGAIDEARLALSDEAHDELDFTRYQAAVAALDALDGAPGASEPQLLTDTQEATQNTIQSLFNSGYLNIKLVGDIKDVTLSHTQGGTTTITLDLNGHKLNNVNISFDPNGGQAGLVIKNGTISGGSISVNGGSVTLSGVTANMITQIDVYGSLTVESGVTGTFNSVVAHNNSTVNIAGGEITGGTFNI